MSVSYFPGCTLYTKAKGLDNSTRSSLGALDIELAELPEWTCCGTVFPLAQDNYMGMVAASRILSSAAKEGSSRLVTVCSFCFNVLKRVNQAVRNNEEARQKLNDYLEDNYTGETEVVHPLEILRDDVGFDNLRGRVNGRFKDVKIACYYGCMLTRPGSEMQFGEEENPAVMEEFTSALGAEPVYFPGKTKCCGSYQLLHNYDLVVDRVREILKTAAAGGARAIITSCPLCQFNLDRVQSEIAGEIQPAIPVLYFTQLLALALDIPGEECGFEQHYIDPTPLLQGK